MSSPVLSRAGMHVLVLFSGLAALSWQIIWQIKSSLALGVSAFGTALTLAVTMGGMCLGALLMGHILRKQTVRNPVRIYGALEAAIGLAGFLLAPAFKLVEQFDVNVYQTSPASAPVIHILGIALALGVPTLGMGATLPVFGLMARQFQTPLSTLYGLNTLGAASGALLAAFVLIPLAGLTHASWAIAAINFAVALVAFSLTGGTAVAAHTEDTSSTAPVPASFILTVCITGFATFLLEVAWFRSLTAAFRSTTDAFAIMLAALLIALGLGARCTAFFKKAGAPLGLITGWAGILVLLATPLIERFDLHTYEALPAHPLLPVFKWFYMTLVAIGPPMFLLGVALPWILDEQKSTRNWGRLYALNSLFSVFGSLTAAWIFLPTIGFARTAWVAGGLVVLSGLALAPRPKKTALAGFGLAALALAIVFESGVGTTRTQGLGHSTQRLAQKILETYEGPEATLSAVEYSNGVRALIIDGFLATQQSADVTKSAEHYMPWMGHLPMLLHPNPQTALVICFGTGQTANAVRRENPAALDIVDINPRVFQLAPHFTTNENVLGDERVSHIVMDGRAYMRRTGKTYDVITLEPMPPSFAGVNALYSKEFYELARSKLGPEGVIAQWLPLHLVAMPYSAGVARTFQSVFPNAILWIDTVSKTGILVGSKNDSRILDADWPGFSRTGIRRDLTEQDVRKAVLLNADGLRRFGDLGKVITDNNQLLAYGNAVHQMNRSLLLQDENFAVLNRLSPPPASAQPE